MGLFNANLSDFFTGRRDGRYVAGGDGGARLTLPELLGAGGLKFGGTYGTNPNANYKDFATTLQSNFFRNLPTMAAQVIGIPIGVRIAKKFLAKPIINPANKLVRSIGITEVKL